MADCHLKVNPTCAVMQANLVMFHLISLNAVTNFSEIERLVCREGFDENTSSWSGPTSDVSPMLRKPSSLRLKSCIVLALCLSKCVLNHITNINPGS